MINEESPSVQAHLQIYQNIISRMAANSSAAKTWCITLVSAILVVVADKGKPDLALLALLPIVLFMFLDSYYLLMENRFRGTFNAFVKNLHESKLTVEDLYAVQPDKNSTKYVLKVIYSYAIWPFYIGLGVMVGLTYCYVLV